jgi:hypothetical protein
MAVLHGEMRSILDKMEIGYEIEVSPIQSQQVGEEERRPETTEESVEQFVKAVSRVLTIEKEQVESPVERLESVERTLKKFLGKGLSSRVEVPFPVNHRISVNRKSQARGCLTTSLWQKREKAAAKKTRKSLAISQKSQNEEQKADPPQGENES